MQATALTSLSFHLLFSRRDAASERGRYTARISLLESLIRRLREGQQISSAEIERLTALGRKLQQGYEADDLGDTDHPPKENISWKEVFLGATRKENPKVSPEEKAKREWNEALASGIRQ